eukprot:747490-Amphidinium_carterae.1
MTSSNARDSKPTMRSADLQHAQSSVGAPHPLIDVHVASPVDDPQWAKPFEYTQEQVLLVLLF